MIVDRKFSVQEEIEGDFEAVDASLSLDDMDLIFSIVSENFYSDIEGSIVRELASNCVDTHTEVGTDEPILIKYSNIEGTEFISFIDYGTGLSPQGFRDVYMKYFRSTKRESNEYVGYFGIGSKSPLGYADSFEVITRFDGKEYHYIVGKSETGKPRADLLNLKDTKEKNGTEVRIAIEPGDYNKFKKAVREQLLYFDNVYIEGFDISNSFNIVEGDNFKYRYSVVDTQHPLEQMHICFGRVVYPINWTALEMEEIKFPIGIKFNIGELKVTNNREQIVYHDEAKELIKKRIELALGEIRDIYNKQNTQEVTLQEYLEIRARQYKLIQFGLIKVPLPYKYVRNDKTGLLEPQDLIPGLNISNYKGFVGTPLTVPDRPFFLFKINDYIQEKNGRQVKAKNFSHIISSDDLDNLFRWPIVSKIAYYRLNNTKRETKKDKYIWWQETKNSTYVNKIAIITRRAGLDYEDYCEALNLKGDSKERNRIYKVKKNITYKLLDSGIYSSDMFVKATSVTSIPYITNEWNKTKLIKFYKKVMTKELVEVTKSYDKTLPSLEYQLYLEANREVRQRVKREGIINAYSMYESAEIKLDLSTLERYTGIILYSYKGDAKRLRPLYNLLLGLNPNQKAVKAYLVGKTYFKHFQGNPYFMSVDEFLNNGNSIIQKIVTAYIVNKKLEPLDLEYFSLVNNIEKLSPKVKEQLTETRKFTSKYIGQLRSLEYSNKELLDEMVNIVTSNNWIIPYYIEELRPIEQFFEDLELFKYIDSKAYENKVGFERIVEYLKFKKKKLDSIYYFIPTPDEQRILDYAEELKEYKYQLTQMRRDAYYSSVSLFPTPYFN